MEPEHPEDKLEDLARLVVAISRETKDYDLFRLGAEFLIGAFDDVCHVSVSLLSKNEDSLFWFKLSTEPDGTHSHIGNMPLVDTASGVVIRRKHMVTTGDFRASGTRYLDYIQYSNDGAVAMVTAPLIVAEKVLGTINVASTKPNAFVLKLHVIDGFAGLLSPFMGLQRFSRELVGVKAVLQRVLPCSIMDRLVELRDYPPPSPSGPAPYGPPPPAAPAAPRHSTYASLAHPRLDPRILDLQKARNTKNGPQPSSCSAKASYVESFADDCCCPEKLEGRYMEWFLSDWRLSTDSACSLLTIASLITVAYWELGQPGRNQWVLALIFLVCGVCTLPIIAFFLTRSRTFYRKWREVILSVMRLLRALIHAAQHVRATALGVFSMHNLLISSGAALLFLHALGYQVRLSMHILVQVTCVAMLLVATLYHGRKLGDAYGEIIVQLMGGFMLPTFTVYMSERRLRLHFDRILQSAEGKKPLQPGARAR